MSTLELQGIRKSFGATHVLHGIDMTLADSEMVVIVGASGSGKSTLLRIVAGLETPTAGQVLLEGRDVTQAEPSARDMAMVFQNYALYPHMRVFDNMAYALRIRGLPRAEIVRRVHEAAEMLGLEALLDRRPRQLSGGQRQRVAMGRAIVREPKLFLFDEPLSNLDAKLRVQMRAEIRRLQRRLGVTSLYVTHDQTEAMTLGDRLLVLNGGHAAQLAPPMEIFDRPADTHVATLIGAPAMNLFAAAFAERGMVAMLENGVAVGLGARYPAQDGTKLTIGIRPEHVALAPDGMPVEVDLIEPLGSETLIHGRIPGGAPVVLRAAGPASGNSLRIALPAGALHVFVAESGKRMEPVADMALAG